MTDPTPQEIRQLLDYVDGRLASADQRDLEAWIAAQPDRAEIVAKLRHAWLIAAQVQSGPLDGDAMWRAVVAARSERPPDQQRATALQPRSTTRRTVAARNIAWMSATLALVAVAIFGWRTSITPTPSSSRSYATMSGQQARITLADGSRVTLAPQSRLIVGDGFGGRERMVTLSGEAYFDVTQGSGAPFVVYAGQVATRVLGTAFDVRYYASDRTVRVAVVHGKVAAGGRHIPPRLVPVVLTPGTVGHFTDSTASATAVDDVGLYTAWTQGRLAFNDTPVPAMLDAVGRWYGYRFQLADSAMANRYVTAVFVVNERAKTLTALKELLDVDMVFDGSVITLRPRQRTRSHAAPTRRAWRTSVPNFTEIGK